MRFDCSCDVKGLESCNGCPVTKNKENIFDYIRHVNETRDHENFIKHLMGNASINGQIKTDGRDELEKALESLGESLNSMSSMFVHPSLNGYIEGIIHTGKFETSSSNDEEDEEESPELTGYNIFYRGHKVGSVGCFEHVRGPKEHWFLDTTGDINTKMSLECDIVEQ